MTNTANDNEIRKQLWKGSIPVLFNIASHDVTSLQTPYPYYTMIPRQSYLPLLIESIRAHFIDFVSSFNKDDLWLEYDEHALKWHLPAGVLFDALNVNNTLPWSITVRFNNFPSEKIYRCTSENDINWNYMNTVKESMYLQYGNVKAIMTMSRTDQNKLWDSVKDSKMAEYEEINEQLKPSDSVIKSYPIRLVFEHNKELKQELIPVSAEEAKTENLEAFLKRVRPDLDLQKTSVIVQGIRPSLETPLDWLIQNISHPDHFFYICLSNK